MNKEIPIIKAEEIADEYGYDQVVILGLRESEDKPNWYHGWKTTFNRDKKKCKFLGKVADILAWNFRAFYSNKKLTNTTHIKLTNEQSDS